jgi:hypothetical protein
MPGRTFASPDLNLWKKATRSCADRKVVSRTSAFDAAGNQ